MPHFPVGRIIPTPGIRTRNDECMGSHLSSPYNLLPALYWTENCCKTSSLQPSVTFKDGYQWSEDITSRTSQAFGALPWSHGHGIFKSENFRKRFMEDLPSHFLEQSLEVGAS